MRRQWAAAFQCQKGGSGIVVRNKFRDAEIEKLDYAIVTDDDTNMNPSKTMAMCSFTRRNQKDFKSASIQDAPVIRKVRANSDQFRCACG